MEKNAILNELNKIFIEVFENKKMTITFSSAVNDFEDWSSLKHIQLIDAIEKQFNIKFKLAEVIKLKTVDEICEGIKEKIAN